jgi:hypothetical protein
MNCRRETVEMDGPPDQRLRNADCGMRIAECVLRNGEERFEQGARSSDRHEDCIFRHFSSL